jgi:hypothetical protein
MIQLRPEQVNVSCRVQFSVQIDGYSNTQHIKPVLVQIGLRSTEPKSITIWRQCKFQFTPAPAQGAGGRILKTEIVLKDTLQEDIVAAYIGRAKTHREVLYLSEINLNAYKVQFRILDLAPEPGFDNKLIVLQHL